MSSGVQLRDDYDAAGLRELCHDWLTYGLAICHSIIIINVMLKDDKSVVTK